MDELPLTVNYRQDGELLFPHYHTTKGCRCSDPLDMERKFFRKLDDTPNLIWQRFALLPNIEGQKYTIGKTFYGREDQGEFIFTKTDTAEDGEFICECKIIIEDGKFWLTPLFSESHEENEIYINEVKVWKKTELRFGDKLSNDGGKTKKILLFKERELNPEAFLREEDDYCKTKDVKPDNLIQKLEISPFQGIFTPGHNGLILSRILSYLTFQEVKIVRSVAQIWNVEALKILRKKSVAKFDFSRGYKNANESMKFFRYKNEIGDTNPLRNWVLTLPHIGPGADFSHEINSSQGEPGAKLLQDLSWFIFDPLKPKYLHVQNLELGGTINGKSDFELRLKILKVLGPHLQEFHCAGNFYLSREEDIENVYKFPDNEINLQKLRVFTLSLHPLVVGEEARFGGFSFHHEAKDWSKLNWLVGLIQAVKWVTRIELQCTASLSASFLNLLVQENDGNLLKQFSNLSQIILHHVNVDVIQILLKMDKVLTKLELKELEELKKADFQLFETLLQKHSRTLKSLQFNIPPSPEGDPIFIKIPKFPKLESLHVDCAPEAFDVSEYIKLVFPGGSGVNYEQDLPSLKSLTLWPSDFERYPEINQSSPLLFQLSSSSVARMLEFCCYHYEIFFPTEVGEGGQVQVCKSLQVLDVMTHVPRLREESIFSGAKEMAIAAMFPNVCNPWVNGIRQSSSRR